MSQHISRHCQAVGSAIILGVLNQFPVSTQKTGIRNNSHGVMLTKSDWSQRSFKQAGIQQTVTIIIVNIT